MRDRIHLLAAIVLAGMAAGCGDGTGPEGPAPTIASVTPPTGTVGTEVKLSGTSFRVGATVLLDTLAATAVDVSSDTAVFASVPTGVVAGITYDVTIRNSDGTEATRPAAFTAVAPTLQFVNSATKPSGNIGSTVILEGDAFGDVQGPGQVLFSDGVGGTVAAIISSPDDWTNTFIVTTVPSSVGDGDVVVQTGTGTSDPLPFIVTQNAVFSPSTITWSTTQDLPVAVSGHHALFVPIDDAGGQTVQYVYASGGASDDGVPRSNIDVSIIQSDGTLSGWNTVTALPAGRAFHTAVAATPFNSRVQGSGYLYVLGGIETAAGQPATTVYSAPLNSDGTLGTHSSETPLPVSLHSLGAVVFRSTIYVAGGATTDDTPVATVYRARIDTLGTLGPWEQLAALPSARAYHAFSTFGGFLYAVGGDSAAVTPDDGNFQSNATKLDEVAFAKIDLRTGDLGSWTVNTNAMQKSRSKHAALVAGGSIFVSAGLYAAAGTGSSENSFAQINSDGTLGPFAGATGSNTLLSVGGSNLFNHAALGYVDAAGVAHVMILGGDDVNTPGSKRKKVLFY